MSNALLFFSGELQKQLQPQKPEDVVNVQRGLLLYRQDMVYQCTENESVITATVQDVTPCKVTLDLTFPDNSQCSCNQQIFCRHQMAVFFTAYSKIRSVSEWITVWKSGTKQVSVQTMQLQKAKELLRDEKPLELTYESWKEFMGDMYKKHIVYHLSQSTYNLTTKWDQYIQRVKAKMPLESEWKLLFTFMLYFQTFLLTMQTLKKEEKLGYTTTQFLKREAADLEEQVHYTAEQLTKSSRPFAFDAFYKGIRNDMAALLEPEPELDGSSIDIYRTIWTHILKEKTWRKAALDELNEALQQKQTNVQDNNFDCKPIAAIHLALLLDEDKMVTSMLEELQPKNYPLLAYWVRQFDEQKTTPFILFIMGHVHDYYDVAPNIYRRKEFVQFFIPHIRRYCQRVKRMELFEKFCEQTLPYSFVPFSHYLLDQEKYKKWVELYLFSNVELEYISTEELNIVTKHEPALLLPIFTSVVQEKIESKNRQSYKAAVRYLKKIRSIYKKEKQMDVWDRYIAKIQSSHTRLRAFQEELKRGKLIHVD
ncbi:SWIM zinc finger family protein [Bacillus sp. 1P06AnD]|uniref:SWIM zinc finger family protein n=1 Tax=Bacillus sp. 1P06AnD TaxID=3132208 RepID=UPI0039A26F55